MCATRRQLRLLVLTLSCASQIAIGYAQQNETDEAGLSHATPKATGAAAQDTASESLAQDETGKAAAREEAPEAVMPEEVSESLARDATADAATPDEVPEAERQEKAAEYLRQAQQAFDATDMVGALSLYRKAAELGDATAQTRLGFLLDYAEQNEQAAAWLKKAAAQGHAEAEFHLAKMYSASGELQQDFGRAVELFESAAQRGHTPAIRVLVSAYETGDLELIRNYDKAVAWLRAGVEARDIWSMQRLSRAYRNGDLGLRIDEDKAGELESMAARQRAQTE
jgi:TPR repeat protein